jgi:zinc protease
MTTIRILTLASVVCLVTTMSIPAAAQMGGVQFSEIHSPKSPLITFRIIVRAGAINDPKGKEGLNWLTATLIEQGGTKDLTYAQVVEKLYPWAANISAQADHELTTFSGTIHRDHLDQFYRLFADLLMTPRFDPADFQRVKDLGLNYLKNTLRSTDDENLGKQSLNAILFDGHPYGRPEVGTVQGLTAITLDDVQQYHTDLYTQANLWIGIAGGYPKTMIETIRKDFGKLPKGSNMVVELPNPEPIKDVEVMVVEKPARAYAVSMGYPISVTRKDKDFYALMVANSYFGEHRTFNGVLMNRLRGDRGLNYGDYSYIEKFTGGVSGSFVFPNLNTPLRQQFFSIWLRPIQPENTHFGIRNALFELNNLLAQGLSNEDFEATRKFVVNYSKLWAATMDRRLGYKMDSEYYGTENFIDRIDKELKTLTVEQVNTAIRKHLRATDIKLAVVVDEGKGQEFLSALEANTPSPIRYSSPVAESILEQDKTIEVFPIVVNSKKSKVVHASELFEK